MSQKTIMLDNHVPLEMGYILNDIQVFKQKYHYFAFYDLMTPFSASIWKPAKALRIYLDQIMYLTLSSIVLYSL